LPDAIAILTCNYKLDLHSTSHYTHIIAIFPGQTFLAGGSSSAYCVDLRRHYVLPGNTAGVKWIKKPTSSGEPCNLQGVLKITPPSWAKSVSFNMTLEKSNRDPFNIVDSSRNFGSGKTAILWF